MRRFRSQTPPLIMVVDNDDDERCLLKAVLRMKGFNVVDAKDGRQAIELATKKLPDLMLIELNLPVVSGSALLCQLRKQIALHESSIVAVSLSTSTFRKQALASGFTAHLDKPVEFDELDAVIDRLLPGR